MVNFLPPPFPDNCDGSYRHVGSATSCVAYHVADSVDVVTDKVGSFLRSSFFMFQLNERGRVTLLAAHSLVSPFPSSSIFFFPSPEVGLAEAGQHNFLRN